MRSKGLNSNVLKIIACICMLIDHITYLWVPKYDPNGWMNVSVKFLVGRSIGRSAFMIFSFLLVEGFFKTKNRAKYIIRMLVVALITEPIFDYMCGRLNSVSFYVLQNILFSFVLALAAMYVLEIIKKKYFIIANLKYNLFSVLVCIVAVTAAHFLRLDYGVVGIALILIFYFMRDMKRSYLVLMVILWTIGCLFLEYQLEWAGLIALIPISMYNGERGSKNLKWFFYVFYPLHMLILGIFRWEILR